MDIPIIILGLIMITIGILITNTQAKALKAGKHQTGDFIVRLLISGIIFIVLGIMMVIKYI
jgi:hypothetical protein